MCQIFEYYFADLLISNCEQMHKMRKLLHVSTKIKYSFYFLCSKIIHNYYNSEKLKYSYPLINTKSKVGSLYARLVNSSFFLILTGVKRSDPTFLNPKLS